MLFIDIGLWSNVPWVVQASWSKGDLEDLGVAKSTFLFLAGDAW
jgi:hypothetical protein